MNYLVTNLYDNPRKLYKYFPISKEYAIKVVDNGKYVGLMFAPNLSREDASILIKVIDRMSYLILFLTYVDSLVYTIEKIGGFYKNV